MAFHGSLHAVGNIDLVQDLSRAYVADLESKPLVDIDETERLFAIDRKRPDDVAEGPDGPGDGMGLRIRYAEQRRLQTCEIGMFAVETVDRVVRAGVGADRTDQVAGARVDDVP